MRALGRILALGRRQAAWLLAGILVALVSVAVGAALMVSSSHALLGRSSADLAAGVALFLGAPVVVRALGLSRALLRYAERLATHEATFRLMAALRVWMFRGLAAGSAGGLGYRRTGDLAARLIGDIESLDVLYARVLVPMAGAVLLLPVLVLGVGLVDVRAGIAAAVLFGLGAFVLPGMAARAALGAGQRLADTASDLRVAVLDGISGLREVRAFGAGDAMLRTAEAKEDQLLRAQRSIAAAASVTDAAALVCSQAALLIVLAASHGGLAPTVTAVFLTVACFETIAGLPRAGVLLGHAAAAASRVLEVSSTRDGRNAAAFRPLPDDYTLRFEGVTAGWSADRDPVLRDLSLQIPAGSRVALLGPSGCGKSTLAALVMRMIPPIAGRVTLGGTSIADLRDADLRRQVALLSQATHVFDDTVRGNLLLGRLDAGDADLWAALDQAALGDWVRGLPQGLDTWVGEGGTNLSGGQARRVALARTLLSRARILILDEPAAGLDADTERSFLSSLFGAAQGRTVILIAHRLTGVEQLDRVWRLSAGHAVVATA